MYRELQGESKTHQRCTRAQVLSRSAWYTPEAQHDVSHFRMAGVDRGIVRPYAGVPCFDCSVEARCREDKGRVVRETRDVYVVLMNVLELADHLKQPRIPRAERENMSDTVSLLVVSGRRSTRWD